MPKVISSETVGLPAGKNTFRDRHGEEAVDQEVEPFEHVADRGGDSRGVAPGAPKPCCQLWLPWPLAAPVVSCPPIRDETQISALSFCLHANSKAITFAQYRTGKASKRDGGHGESFADSGK